MSQLQVFSILASICLRLKDQGESVHLARGSYVHTLVRGPQSTSPGSSTRGRGDGPSRGNRGSGPKRDDRQTSINKHPLQGDPTAPLSLHVHVSNVSRFSWHFVHESITLRFRPDGLKGGSGACNIADSPYMNKGMSFQIDKNGFSKWGKAHLSLLVFLKETSFTRAAVQFHHQCSVSSINSF